MSHRTWVKHNQCCFNVSPYIKCIGVGAFREKEIDSDVVSGPLSFDLSLEKSYSPVPESKRGVFDDWAIFAEAA